MRCVQIFLTKQVNIAFLKCALLQSAAAWKKRRGGGELVSEDIEKMLREISPPQ